MTKQELRQYKPKADKLIESIKQIMLTKHKQICSRHDIVLMLSVLTEYDLFESIQLIQYLKDLERLSK